ncbi:tetratricopeptide repeat protein [Actinoplanes sp. NPDC051470]|uniref:tetratricopeptide repeat protein n=1 Tax=Actinoplanes sp. NPDC051470 TaxID=3157224 RepID=UPI003421C4C9
MLTAADLHDDDRAVAVGEVSWLLSGSARYMRVQGQPGRAEPLLRRALELNEGPPGPTIPTLPSIWSNLAGVLVDLGRSAEALPLAERAQAITDRRRELS